MGIAIHRRRKNPRKCHIRCTLNKTLGLRCVFFGNGFTYQKSPFVLFILKFIIFEHVALWHDIPGNRRGWRRRSRASHPTPKSSSLLSPPSSVLYPPPPPEERQKCPPTNPTPQLPSSCPLPRFLVEIGLGKIELAWQHA